ncbi:uncharacterized protein NEMAJ01_1114 [Nematocida major]|uniref:uncharacterized protein n=1 Tax=Nematocida major TaxID=1912982 RepID=UPI002007F0A1|nr:uncharacterized protein NEMAJ01_1114 [Nematocida major]KAH9386218.1 hypothetical protein NEMAJ01_1114 [Nematocida major]
MKAHSRIAGLFVGLLAVSAHPTVVDQDELKQCMEDLSIYFTEELSAPRAEAFCAESTLQPGEKLPMPAPKKKGNPSIKKAQDGLQALKKSLKDARTGLGNVLKAYQSYIEAPENEAPYIISSKDNEHSAIQEDYYNKSFQNAIVENMVNELVIERQINIIKGLECEEPMKILSKLKNRQHTLEGGKLGFDTADYAMQMYNEVIVIPATCIKTITKAIASPFFKITTANTAIKTFSFIIDSVFRKLDYSKIRIAKNPYNDLVCEAVNKLSLFVAQEEELLSGWAQVKDAELLIRNFKAVKKATDVLKKVCLDYRIDIFDKYNITKREGEEIFLSVGKSNSVPIDDGSNSQGNHIVNCLKKTHEVDLVRLFLALTNYKKCLDACISKIESAATGPKGEQERLEVLNEIKLKAKYRHCMLFQSLQRNADEELESGALHAETIKKIVEKIGRIGKIDKKTTYVGFLSHSTITSKIHKIVTAAHAHSGLLRYYPVDKILLAEMRSKSMKNWVEEVQAHMDKKKNIESITEIYSGAMCKERLKGIDVMPMLQVASNIKSQLNNLLAKKSNIAISPAPKRYIDDAVKTLDKICGLLKKHAENEDLNYQTIRKIIVDIFPIYKRIISMLCIEKFDLRNTLLLKELYYLKKLEGLQTVSLEHKILNTVFE